MAHARLSPSASKRWLTCPGSVALCEAQDEEQRTSKYAAEGTVAHEIGERCLLEHKEPKDFLGKVMEARKHLSKAPSLFLKIAPDLFLEELADIADVALLHSVDAIIATNTTLDRPELSSPDRSQAGGLSGRPLFDKSTRVLAQLSAMLKGQIPLIGVGGISNALDAYTKICAGATAVQLYTAFTFEGFSLLGKIASDLDEQLAKEGFENVRDAVGSNTNEWL